MLQREEVRQKAIYMPEQTGLTICIEKTEMARSVYCQMSWAFTE